jgi:hypothetical protein
METVEQIYLWGRDFPFDTIINIINIRGKNRPVAAMFRCLLFDQEGNHMIPKLPFEKLYWKCNSEQTGFSSAPIKTIKAIIMQERGERENHQ